jgi:hypothetical protein
MLVCVANIVLTDASLLRRVLAKGDEVLDPKGTKGTGDNNATDTVGVCAFQQPFYIYLIIPLISGLIGYVTNVVALKMTFYPLEFVPKHLEFVRVKDQPIGLFGWQGIIPTKAAKMAATSCDIMTEKLFNMVRTCVLTLSLSLSLSRPLFLG